MAHKRVQDYFFERVQHAVKLAASIKDEKHQGTKGRVREIIAAKMLRPLLPTGFDITNGHLIDSSGGTSAECDLIIYSRHILPPILYDKHFGYVTIEASIYAIEVKSKITAAEIRDSVKKFRSIHSLQPMQDGDFRPRNVLLGLGSDLKESDELQRFQGIDSDAVKWNSPACDAISILRKGYWYWQPDSGTWNGSRPDGECGEIVDLLVGLSNTIPRLVSERRGLEFGRYLGGWRLG